EDQKLVAGFREHVELLLSDAKDRNASIAAMEEVHRAALADKEAALVAAREQLAAATRQVELGASRATAAESRLEQLAAELQKTKTNAERVAAERRQFEARFRERSDEIAKLSRFLRESETTAQHQADVLEHVRHSAGSEFGRAVAAMLDGRGWSLLPRRLRRKRQMAYLEKLGLFNREWYLCHYSDVASAGIDPLEHYIEHGVIEGRAPNPRLVGSAEGQADPPELGPEKRE